MDTTEAYSLARRTMNEYGLGGWILEWDRAKRRSGQTTHSKRTISLSYEYVRLNPLPTVRNTILHEVAHGMVGPGHKHDEVWRRQFIAIGGDGKRCTDVAVRQEGKIVGTCPDGHLFHKHRWTQKLKTTTYFCPKHGTAPSAFRSYPIVWRENRGL